MASRAKQHQAVSVPSKALAAAAVQSQQPGRSYDPKLLTMYHEGDPIDVGRNGVISVQVYNYNGGETRIGIYRVGISKKTGNPWQVKELCPLNLTQATTLAAELQKAAKVLEKLGGKKS